MKTRNNKILIQSFSVLIAISIAFVFHFSSAQSPREINISAYLVNGENKELPNGEYEVRFALYGNDRNAVDPYPSNSDSRTWEEVQKIKIQDGFLNAYLGAISPIPDSINFSKNSYYLGIRIGTDSEMAPRKRIGSVPVAVDTFSVQGSVPGSAAGDLVLLGSSGKVDIKQLPTGTKSNQLVLGNDKRLNQKITISGGYNYLTISGSKITLNQIDLATDVSGLLSISNGGTGVDSFVKGDMLYYDSGSSLSKLGIGNNGQVITSSGGLPVWANPAVNAYSASGTLLRLSGSVFSLKEGVLTNGKLCTYSSANGLVCNTEPAAGGVAYTAGNGITLSGAEFDLGGTLSELTNIALNSNNFVFSGTGNVGIGTTDPGQVLDVTGGSIRTSGQFISTVTIGTAPLAVTSTTLVSNLNSDLLDGNHASAFALSGHNHDGTYEPIVSNGTANYIWGMNASGTGKEWKQLVEGDNITITNAANSITIAAADSNSYSASGALLNLTGSVFSVKEGTLTDGKLCVYVSGTGAGTGLVCNTNFGDVGASYTAGNGLTLSGSVFKLGGTLSELTNIALNSNNFVFSGAGNVGIGTTDPKRILDMNGAIHISSVSIPGSPVSGDIYSDGTNIYFYNGSGWDDLTYTGAGVGQWDNVTGGINYAGGNVGIGNTNPTAYLNIKAGTSAAGTAPLKFTSGTNLTVPENGAMEYDGAHLYFTVGSDRYQLDQQGSSAYTAGNGLTLSGSVFKLGGTLSELTNIALNSNNFVFSGTGNVGIGTTDPKGMFDANGKLTILSGGNIGIGTVTPTRIIGIGGNSNRNIGMERGTVSEAAGYGLTINAGGATLGSSDSNGGDLYLSSGISTGKGTSGIYFKTSLAATSGKIKSIASTPTLGGSGYSSGDVLTVTSDGTGGQVRVSTVDGSGMVLTLDSTPISPGSGYVVGTGKGTTGGGGIGCTVNVTEITETSDNALTTRMAISGNGKIGMGTTNPRSAVEIVSGSEQLRLSNDASNYFSFLVNSTGDLTMTPSGGTGGIRIIGSDSDEPIIIGGMPSNTSTGLGSFIGNGTGNGITGTESFIGSGNWNVVSGNYSFIGAGSSNTVSGSQSYIGGGNSNQVTGTYSYIGGGWNNQVSGWSSAVFGGNGNIVTGSYAAVVGGLDNLAGANYTVVAGRQSRTTTQGTFVFSDSQNVQFNINVNDAFGMRFQGGYLLTGGNVGIGTTDPLQKLSVSGDASFTGYVYGRGGVYGLPGSDVTGISNAWLGAKWTSTSQNGLSLKGPSGQAANYLQVSSSTGTGDVFVVNSAGHVGIGVTSPTAQIHLAAGTAAAGTAPIKFNNGVLLSNLENGAMEYDGAHLYFTVGSYRYQIDQQPGTTYTEGDDINIVGSQISVNSQLDHVSVINQTSSDLLLKTTTSGNIILNPAGNVGIGKTNPGYKLDIATSAANDRGININQTAATGTNYGVYSSVTGAATANYAGYFTASGASTNYGLYVGAGSIYTPLGDGTVTVSSNVLTTSSDERLKNITGKFSRGLEEILGIDPILYKWNEVSGLNMNPVYAGFSAQNIRSVIPEAVSTDSRGYLSLSDRPILAAAINAIKQHQDKITSIDSLTQNNGLEISDLNLRFSEKYSILSGQFDTLKEQVGNDPFKLEMIGVESRVDAMEKRLAALEPEDKTTANAVTKNISFQTFSSNNDVASSLTNTQVADNIFSGDYAAPDVYNEIIINQPGIDVSGYDVQNGYLTYNMYVEDPSAITDMAIELGNEMDLKEIQWNKDKFRSLTSGWNQIKLKISDGIKTGEVDWSSLNYLRIYFKFSATDKVKISNVKIEVTETVTKVAGTDSINQLSILGSQFTDFNSQITTLNSQMADIKKQTEANTNLLLSMDPKNMVYKDTSGSVDLLKGQLEAEGVVAGTFTVKNVDDKPKTIGEATIKKVEKEDNGDGIDDEKTDADGEKTIDGKNVLIKTKAVSDSAKVFISFESNPSAYSWVDKVKDKDGNYTGFKIMIDKAVDKDVKVNWWIVESK